MTVDGSAPTLDALGEDGVLEAILARVPTAPPGAGLLLGPGDDAAVSRISGRLVTTTDMLVEGEDFLASWLDPVLLGRKAAAQNLADVCAMGAAPHGLVISLGAPGATAVEVLGGIMEGFAQEAARAGAGVFGGDLSGGPCLILSVTALGDLSRQPIVRSGAQPGDLIALVGTVGHAAAGLDLLLAGVRPGDDRALDPFIAVQRGPQPDYAGARAAGLLAHSMIDVSDGLVGDLGRIAHASGVCAELDPSAIDQLAQPLLPAARALRPEASTEQLHAQARIWALTGGEDHGFLLTAPGSRLDPVPLGLTIIGHCLEGDPGVTLGGEPVALRAFSHFTGDR